MAAVRNHSRRRRCQFASLAKLCVQLFKMKLLQLMAIVGRNLAVFCPICLLPSHEVAGFREIHSIRSHLPRQLSATLRRSAISCSLVALNRSRCLRTAEPMTFHGFHWSTESSSFFGCDLFLGHRLNGRLTASLTEGLENS